jgi:hypothetical protein
MRQEIYDDPHGIEDWHTAYSSRCFAHIANSLVWREVTGEDPPTVPPTAREYARAGLPWFQWYGEQPAIKGGKQLTGLKSVKQIGQTKGDVPLPENGSLEPGQVVNLGPAASKNQVREGEF